MKNLEEFRSMFSNIFHKQDNADGSENNDDTTGRITTQFKMLGSYDNYFSRNPDSLYDDATIRTCIDTIARSAAKFQLHHIRTDSHGNITRCNDSLDKLLTTRPNPYMSQYDFLYKLVAMLYTDNNVYVYIDSDSSGNIIGLYPLGYQEAELREYAGRTYVRFQFLRNQMTVPYDQLIHLRRHYNGHDIFGQPNTPALTNPLNILNSVKQALESAVKNCMKLRYVIKLQDIMDEDDKVAHKQQFDNDFRSVQNGTGTAVIDAGADFQQLNSDIKLADHEQMNFVRDDLFHYFGISGSVVNGNPTAADMEAFVSLTLAPLAAQLEQEFTTKIFTNTELGYGNKIQITIDRVEFQTLDTKITMVSKLIPAGVLTVNECRHLLGYDPMEDENCDKLQITLNNVQLEDQSDYQLGKVGKTKDDAQGNSGDNGNQGNNGNQAVESPAPDGNKDEKKEDD